MIILTEKGDIMALEETVLDGGNMTNLLKANWDISCISYRKLYILSIWANSRVAKGDRL